MSLDNMMEIQRNEETIATVTKLRSDTVPYKFEVKNSDNLMMEARGTFYEQSEIRITRGDAHIATMSRKAYTITREIFYINMEEGEDEALLLAIGAALIALVDYHGELSSTT